MDSGIYMIVNKANGNRYVGQTINFRKRFIQHRTKTHQARSVIGRAMRKHGKDGFEFVILERCSAQALDAREIHHIAAMRPEYNMTTGGRGSSGHRASPEVRAHLAKTSKAAWDRLPKSAQDAIVARIQANRRPASVETRAKIGTARRRYCAANIYGTSKPVIQMDGAANNLAYFKSVNDAAKAVGVHASAISRAVKGQRTLAAGYFWKYQRENDKQ